MGLLEFFGGISVVQVLLDSWEYEDDRAASKEDYVKASEALYERDARALKERKWAVQYIDRQGNVYGELEAQNTSCWPKGTLDDGRV